MVGWHHQLDGHEFEQVKGDEKNDNMTVPYCYSRGIHILVSQVYV